MTSIRSVLRASLILAAASVTFACQLEGTEAGEAAERASAEVTTASPLVGKWRSIGSPSFQLTLERTESVSRYELATCADASCAGEPRDREVGSWAATSAKLTLTTEGHAVDEVKSREFVFLLRRDGDEPARSLLLETNLPLEPAAGPPPVHEVFSLERVPTAGPSCGAFTCEAGKTCCDVATGACAAPGELCLF